MKQNGSNSEQEETLHQPQIGIPDGTVQWILVQVVIDLVCQKLETEWFVGARSQVEDLQLGRTTSVLGPERDGFVRWKRNNYAWSTHLSELT